ncbi:MAG: hypothetical protein PHF37_04385 [Phycisphaerae bacterium]|nr:hypothetical protein [Phycisphaerae bacterium]
MKHISYIPESTVGGRSGCRKAAEAIEAWVDQLDPKEGAMMKLYLRGGGFTEIGQLCGTRPENVARRVQKVITRVAAAKFCQQNRTSFSRSELAITKYYFLRGMTIRQISAIKHQPYKTVNKIVLGVKEKMELLRK